MADDSDKQGNSTTADVPSGRSPLVPTGLRRESPEPAGGGRRGLAEVLGQLTEVSGLGRGKKVLDSLNQWSSCVGPGNGFASSPSVRSKYEFEENDAKLALLASSKTCADGSFFAAHTVARMREWSDLRLSRSGRLTQPLLREEGADHYRPLSWSRAERIVGESLKALERPEQAVFYSSGQSSNEAAFMWQIFARRFGSNNLPHAGDFCETTTDAGMRRVLGSAEATVSHADLQKTECFLLIGHNPGSNQTRLLRTLADAKRRGASIIAINPLPEAGLQGFDDSWRASIWAKFAKSQALADVHLPVRLNQDLALLKGLMKVQFTEEDKHPGKALDHWFLETHTSGYTAWREELENTSWADLVSDSGCSREQIEAAGRLIAHAKGVVAIWGNGLCQHDRGSEKVAAVCNLLMLGGHLRRRGSGLWPVRGQVNLEGSKRMGCRSEAGKDFRRALGKEFEFTLPRKRGLDVHATIDALHQGKAKVLLALGGNLLAASPDTDGVAEALTNCELTVSIATHLNRFHLVPGRRSLILPCLSRTEYDRVNGSLQVSSCEDSLGQVQASRGAVEPIGKEIRSESAIIAGLALETIGAQPGFAWDRWGQNNKTLRSRITKVVPSYHDYELRLAQAGGFSATPKETLAATTEFGTEDGKAQFCLDAQPGAEPNLGGGRFLLTTLRSHGQFNSQILSLDDRPRGIFGERRILMMNRREMRDYGFQPGEAVEIVSEYDGVERRVSRFHCVPCEIPRGGVAAYFPEANPLFPSIGHDAGDEAAPKSLVVTVSSSPWS